MPRTPHAGDSDTPAVSESGRVLLSLLDPAVVTRLSDPKRSVELSFALAHSRFIEQAARQHPSLFSALVMSGDLWKSHRPEQFTQAVEAALPDEDTDADLTECIALVRMREMVRIAWRDLNRLASLEETTRDLSLLAEACVSGALDRIHRRMTRRHGTPLDHNGREQQLIVLGMGKLGARELNFSSDIDLIFAFPEEGEMESPRRADNCEMFFTRLCREFLKVFRTAGSGISLFRVDTRLRPFGDSGPLVMSADALEIYYQTQGREWERYALIKARPVAGDIPAGFRLLEHLKPFIFRRYLDYGAFESFRDMKERIARQVRDKRLIGNVKLGAGGIREIEFFGQLFQLIRGGVTPQLQEKKIRNVLPLLVEEGLIRPKTGKDLDNAYLFLRDVEHRLQEFEDRQTHDLPVESSRRHLLARSMGFEDWEAFEHQLNVHMETVHSHFQGLLAVEEKTDGQESDLDQCRRLWESINDPQFDPEPPHLEGYRDPERVLKILIALAEHPNTRKLTRNGRKRLNQLVPLVIEKAGTVVSAETALERVVGLITAVEQRTCYLSLLLENPPALATLITLAVKSPWVIRFVSRHPALLDELMNPDALASLAGPRDLEKSLDRRMAAIPASDGEFLLEELCVFKQTHMLRVAVADLSGDHPLMKVSDALTHIAEAVLQRVLTIAWHQVSARYGIPSGIHFEASPTPGFAAVAYGKLGGIELGYKSDLDLVFIHSGNEGMTRGGPRSIENIRFYTLLGQRIISMLTMHTPAGTLYEPDMRLRPSGQSGMIVSHLEGFEEYMMHQAWTWEHQAIIRARPVAGDPTLYHRFNRIREAVLTRKREPERLRQEIQEMRRRIKKEHVTHNAHEYDLKQGSGGIVDLEFLVQYLTLAHARRHPALLQWTDNIRLLETLADEKILTRQEAQELIHAYITLRRTVHRRDLEETRDAVSPDLHEEQTRRVSLLYQRFLEKRMPT